jgi:hypothetical protein
MLQYYSPLHLPYIWIWSGPHILLVRVNNCFKINIVHWITWMTPSHENMEVKLDRDGTRQLAVLIHMLFAVQRRYEVCNKCNNSTFFFFFNWFFASFPLFNISIFSRSSSCDSFSSSFIELSSFKWYGT